MKEKIFILLPDGVGLRNFAFTNFYKIGQEHGYDIIFWNNTSFDLRNLKYSELKIEQSKLHPLTDLLKRAKIFITLNIFKNRFNDPIYDSYKFPFQYNNWKSVIKSFITNLIILIFNSKTGILILNKFISNLERKTSYYKDCKSVLKQHKPKVVFCTNQRSIKALAPILAAKDLNIPTVCFIFSWDNLPKATLIVETDYFFVWSEHMKKELIKYYPNTQPNQIKITGTPQFEPHYDKIFFDKNEEYDFKYKIDPQVDYICFSGDDETTSPYDPEYLDDLCKSIILLNQQGHNFKVIFRRCPVDFSKRFDDVIKKNAEIILNINPLWKKLGNQWDTVVPTIDDLYIQMFVISRSKVVVNLGSSMIFDFAIHNKPCVYINYLPKGKSQEAWSNKIVYKFVHFRSKPTEDVVTWVNDPSEYGQKIVLAIENKNHLVRNANKWFNKINHYPQDKASERIWETFNDEVLVK